MRCPLYGASRSTVTEGSEKEKWWGVVARGWSLAVRVVFWGILVEIWRALGGRTGVVEESCP